MSQPADKSSSEDFELVSHPMVLEPTAATAKKASTAARASASGSSATRLPSGSAATTTTAAAKKHGNGAAHGKSGTSAHGSATKAAAAAAAATAAAAAAHTPADVYASTGVVPVGTNANDAAASTKVTEDDEDLMASMLGDASGPPAAAATSAVPRVAAVAMTEPPTDDTRMIDDEPSQSKTATRPGVSVGSTLLSASSQKKLASTVAPVRSSTSMSSSLQQQPHVTPDVSAVAAAPTDFLVSLSVRLISDLYAVIEPRLTQEMRWRVQWQQMRDTSIRACMAQVTSSWLTEPSTSLSRMARLMERVQKTYGHLDAMERMPLSWTTDVHKRATEIMWLWELWADIAKPGHAAYAADRIIVDFLKLVL